MLKQNFFQSQHGELFAENVPLKNIAASVGTPCYVYSRAALVERYLRFEKAFQNFPHQIHYAVKANSNLAILKILSNLGSGFDIVSEGELERVLAVGCDPKKIVFSGVGKNKRELKRAIEVGVGCINIESSQELFELHKIAKQMNKEVGISLRINPNIDAKSHPYISTGLKENKFGIGLEEAQDLYLKAKTLYPLKISGIDCHIGSQITTLAPFLEALEVILAFKNTLKKQGISINHLNLGGGLGVCYQAENPPEPSIYVKAILDKISNQNVTLFLEPGRAIAANAGILLTQVEYLKTSEQGPCFAIVDAGMNDLLRPALYNAWQNIVPVIPHNDGLTHHYDIVGPVCETADFLGKNRLLCLKPGDLLAIFGAGAYGFTMSSNYNSRPRAAEVMVDRDQFHIIRQRENIKSLFALESILPE